MLSVTKILDVIKIPRISIRGKMSILSFLQTTNVFGPGIGPDQWASRYNNTGLFIPSFRLEQSILNHFFANLLSPREMIPLKRLTSSSVVFSLKQNMNKFICDLFQFDSRSLPLTALIFSLHSIGTSSDPLKIFSAWNSFAVLLGFSRSTSCFLHNPSPNPDSSLQGQPGIL